MKGNFMPILKQILLSVALLGAPGLALADQDYELTCVFGPGQQVHLSTISTPQFASTQLVTMSFTPANRPSTQGVDPGTCAWSDRAFRAGEASTIAVITGDNSMTYFAANGVVQSIPSTQSWVAWLNRSDLKKVFKVHAGFVPTVSYQVLIAQP
jgi:hypothetical protein